LTKTKRQILVQFSSKNKRQAYRRHWFSDSVDAHARKSDLYTITAWTAVARNTCSVVPHLSRKWHIRVYAHVRHISRVICDEMRVHDDADPKYSAMGKSSKLSLKRPSTVVFRENSGKVQKTNEDNRVANATKNNDKTNVGLHQRRKSLPVYMLRKR